MGKNFDQGGSRDYLLLLASLRVLVNIDDLEGIAFRQVIGADFAHVFDCEDGARRLPTHEQTQYVLVIPTDLSGCLWLQVLAGLESPIVCHLAFPCSLIR